MKTAYFITISLFLCGVSASEEIWESGSISGSDLVDILELGVEKHVVEFDKPKLVTLHFESKFQTQEWTLERPQTKVSVLIYRPKSEDPEQAPGIGTLTLRLKGEPSDGAVLSYGTYEKDKAKFRTTNYRGGLEIVAKENKAADDFIYRIYVTTID